MITFLKKNADIIKSATMFIKAIFRDSKIKLRELEIMLNLLISSEKMLMSAELKGRVTWFIYFFDLL